MKLDMVLGVDKKQRGINTAYSLTVRDAGFSIGYITEQATTLEQPGQLGLRLLDLYLYLEYMSLYLVKWATAIKLG
jgi:hypothetical protein